MPICVYLDASIGKVTAGAGIRIDLGSDTLKPIDLSFPLGKIDSPNEAEVIVIHRASDIFVNLLHLINSNRRLEDEYIILKTDSAAAVRAIELCERIKEPNLRTLAKRARKAWDDVRIDRPKGPGFIAGWSIEKIPRHKNPAHKLAASAVTQLEGLYKWIPSATNSGTSSSKASKSARRQPR